MKTRPVLIVCERDATVADMLPRLGEEAARALGEGRVFVGKRRVVLPGERVLAGDEVQMYAPRCTPREPARILLERDGVVAAYKPPEMATVADHRGAAGTLEREVARLLGSKELTLVPTSRLDVGVSGVVIFAITEVARIKLARAREQGRYRRHYVAISQEAPTPSCGTWGGPIGRARDPRRRCVGGRDAVVAETTYASASTTVKATVLAVEPVTGRTHQIRVHAAHAGCPLLGDAVYGGVTRLVSEDGSVRPILRIALHAAWVEVPLAGPDPLRVEAALPDDLRALWVDCGGLSSAWPLAWAPVEAPVPPTKP